MSDRELYHPLSLIGKVPYESGQYFGNEGRLDDSSFGKTLELTNRRDCPIWIAGIRSLNGPWQIVILSLGAVRGPFDAAAFNLDAIPGPPSGRGYPLYPSPELPRFVHYPLGSLAPGESLSIRACSYDTPSLSPVLNLLFFISVHARLPESRRGT